MNKKVIKIIISIMIIIITLMSNKSFATEGIMFGDINKDNRITSRDFLLLLNHVVATTTKKHKEWILTDEQLKVADITGDGKVDSRDYLAILKYVIADNNKKIAKKYPEWKEYIEERQENPNVTPTPEPEPTPEVVKVSKISLYETEIKLEIEKTVQLIATIEPENATNKEIEWTSSNEKVATISSNGMVTAKGEGTAIITVTSQSNKEKTATCTVTVEPKQEPIPTPVPTPDPTPQIVEVTEVNIKDSVTLDMSGTKATTLTAKILPQNATNKNIGWTSSNDKIATVTQNGRITARKNGTVTITATSKSNNNKKATCKVTVKTSATSVKIKGDVNKTINLKQTPTLKAILTPSDSTDTVTWKSSKTSIATINKKTGKITPKKDGKTTITARTKNGKVAKCQLTVTGGYWEIKNGKYIYHYSDGTKKLLSKSCYVSWKKIKNVKSYDPTIPNEDQYPKKEWVKKPYTYAGVYHPTYYCYDKTADNIAIKNGTSPYAIVVDESIAVVHIYRRKENKWVPDRTFTAAHLSIEKNNVLLGLHYISGNRQPIAYPGHHCHFWVAYGVKGGNDYNEAYFHYSPSAPKGDAEGVTGEARGMLFNTGCVMLSWERSEWIYKNCGRGTPVLIY